MVSKELEALAWRWEFMRRNPEYRKDWEHVSRLPQKNDFSQIRTKKKKGKSGSGPLATGRDEYAITPQRKEERNICERWGVAKMIDPNISLLNLLENDAGENSSEMQRLLAWATAIHALHSLEQGAVFVDGDFESQDSIGMTFKGSDERGHTEVQSGYSRIRLSIDFTRVNSLSQLKAEVNELLGFHFSNFVKRQKRSARKQTYNVDFRTLLRVGEMKEKERLTNQQIAKKIFPNDFKGEQWGRNPESAIRKVSHYSKRYKELVNGGYKDLTFP
jgi:hypothetical protein